MQSSQQPDLKIIVVDDHELTRFSLQLALSSQQNLQLVGLASNGKEAIEMVEAHHPDVVILDLQMPVLDGLSASNEIKALNPRTQIIAYSSWEDPQTEVMSQTARIDAFCSKETSNDELVDLINKLGQRAISQR
jgi:DNA-binding NarL/FixJ family response regulator